MSILKMDELEQLIRVLATTRTGLIKDKVTMIGVMEIFTAHYPDEHHLLSCRAGEVTHLLRSAVHELNELLERLNSLVESGD